MSSDIENEYFSDGMTEEIINALAKLKDLKVTSRTSSFFFKGKNIPIPEIGEKLGVSIILEGSIRLSGSQVRITAQLIDVLEDFHFWSETFDRSTSDIFKVQDEVSLLIADKLREHIGHFEIEDHLVDAIDIPVDVYQTYLKGRFHLMKLTLPETEIAIEIFKEVIAQQPDFPLPYLDINQGYAFLGTMGLIPAHEGFMKAQPFLEKAIELAPDLPEVQLNLAWISCWQNWDFETAYQHLNNALEVRQNDVFYLTMSNMLAVQGKFEAALTYIEKALQHDPFGATNHSFKGFIYYMQEKYAEAMPHLRQSLVLKPELPFPHIYLGTIPLLEGRMEEGLAFFEKLKEGEGGALTKLGGTTMAYAAMGNTEKTEQGIQALKARLESPAMGSALNFLIFVEAIRGNFETALDHIEMGIGMRLPMMLLLYTEPILKPLRSDKKFQALMKTALGERTAFVGEKKKYKKSLLNQALLAQQKQRLETQMIENQVFLDPSLSIRSLAEMLDLQPNYLSQLLNEGFDQNFAEYVNTYRLEAFKSKVADKSQQHLTILALAFESGFNSKTVFNTFFKKAMGMTPKVYWNQVLGEG